MRLAVTPPKHLRKASNKIVYHIYYVSPCYHTSALCVQNGSCGGIDLHLQVLVCILKFKSRPSLASSARLTILQATGS